MNLRAGIVGRSPLWEQLLAIEGIPFGSVDPSSADDECSILVIAGPLADHDRAAVERYLASGGALVGYAEFATGIGGTRSRRERIDYLLPDGNDEIFPDIGILDLAIEGSIPREANCLRTHQNIFSAFAGQLGGGYAVLLPFDPAAMMGDGRFAQKSFYADRERLPSERVSMVSKGEIVRVLHRSFRYLHHVRGIPYVHVWYFPDGKRNVSAFRVDTDKGSREEIDTLAHLAVEHDVGMSWFVDVRSHEDWLHHFAFLAGQEIGVHCYEHVTYSSFEENHRNIAKAKRKLELAGISVPGFAAPFGVWNPGLARAIDKLVFEYSSEFSYAYDTFPFYPANGEEIFLTPQIPIHPVCIGSLKRVGYTPDQMKTLFWRTIDAKLQRDEPLFFYHHPTHRCWDVVEFMFEYLEEQEIESLTLLEFARWWRTRLKFHPVLIFEPGDLTIAGSTGEDDAVWLHIIDPAGREVFHPACKHLALDALDWTPPRAAYRVPADIRRIREFDPRRALGDLFATVQRKLSEKRR